jgi:glycine oxidase
MQRADVAIAGAGIIGLAAALELAAAGLRVVVFDRGHAMRESSWAAAGMLAAADPENPSELRQLSELSLSLYPGFLSGIERLSGKKVPIRTSMTLQGAPVLPPNTKELGADRIQSIAPGLKLNGLKFFLLEEQSLDPRDLAHAVLEATKAAGVTLLEQTAVTAIQPQHNAVHIHTSSEEWSADNFINACGAWASDLESIPITPRKGQMLLVECPHTLATVLRTPHLYLVPRGNGSILIGATVEDAGYDKQLDPGAIAALHNAAAELWPPIREARIADTWSGLRPASADLLPVIGPDREDDAQKSRSWLALGHFRNGILLAPATAHLLRQMILGQPLSIDISAFRPGRFAAARAR